MFLQFDKHCNFVAFDKHRGLCPFKTKKKDMAQIQISKGDCYFQSHCFLNSIMENNNKALGRIFHVIPKTKQKIKELKC